MSIALSAPFPEDEGWERWVKKYFEMVCLRPDNLAFRQSLRSGEYRLRQEQARSISFLTKTRLTSYDMQLVDLLYAQEFARLDHCAEEMLKLDPWDSIANTFAAKACIVRGYYEVGRFLLGCALQECLKSRFLLDVSIQRMSIADMNEINWSVVIDVAIGLREDRWR